MARALRGDAAPRDPSAGRGDTASSPAAGRAVGTTAPGGLPRCFGGVGQGCVSHGADDTRRLHEKTINYFLCSSQALFPSLSRGLQAASPRPQGSPPARSPSARSPQHGVRLLTREPGMLAKSRSFPASPRQPGEVALREPGLEPASARARATIVPGAPGSGSSWVAGARALCGRQMNALRQGSRPSPAATPGPLAFQARPVTTSDEHICTYLAPAMCEY